MIDNDYIMKYMHMRNNGHTAEIWNNQFSTFSNFFEHNKLTWKPHVEFQMI